MELYIVRTDNNVKFMIKDNLQHPHIIHSRNNPWSFNYFLRSPSCGHIYDATNNKMKMLYIFCFVLSKSLEVLLTSKSSFYS